MLKVWQRPKRSLNSGRFGRCVTCFFGRELKDSFEREFFERSSQKPAFVFGMYPEPVCPLFWGLNPLKEGPNSNQNKWHHLGSRYIFCRYFDIFPPSLFKTEIFFSYVSLCFSNTNHPLQVRNYGEVRKQPPGEPEGSKG